MSEYNTWPTVSFTDADRDELNAAIQAKETLALRVEQLTRQRDEVTASRRVLVTSLQGALEEFANSRLQVGDEDYKALSDLMVDNGLDGLKRTFTVTVRVSYDFEVEVEASDEDEARDEVDNNLYTYAQDYVDLSSPDDQDIEAQEA